MIKIKAEIELYSGDEKRRTPFFSGYRPGFEFIAEMRTDGAIKLLDRESFSPGEQGQVEIVFLSGKYLGDSFSEGSKFRFFESAEPIGEGTVMEIL